MFDDDGEPMGFWLVNNVVKRPKVDIMNVTGIGRRREDWVGHVTYVHVIYVSDQPLPCNIIFNVVDKFSRASFSYASNVKPAIVEPP